MMKAKKNIISSDKTHIIYDGNGSTTEFSFRFRIFEAAQLKVAKIDPNDNQTQLKEGTDYNLKINDTGGNVSYPVSGEPLPLKWKLLIYREVPAVMLYDFLSDRAYWAKTHQDAFDYVMMCIQQNLSNDNSSLKFPITDPSGISHLLPPVAKRKNMILGFDDQGNPITENNGQNATNIMDIPIENDLKEKIINNDILVYKNGKFKASQHALGTVREFNGVVPDREGKLTVTADNIPEGQNNKYFDQVDKAKVDSNADHIQNHYQELQAQENIIQTNKDNISTNQKDITTNSNHIDNHYQELEAQEIIINKNKAKSETNETNIKTANKNIDNNYAELQAQESIIQTNKDNISSNSKDITTNSNHIDNHYQELQTQEGLIQTNKTDINNNATDISNNTTDISGINTELDDCVKKEADLTSGMLPKILNKNHIEDGYAVGTGKNHIVLTDTNKKFPSSVIPHIEINDTKIFSYDSSTTYESCPMAWVTQWTTAHHGDMAVICWYETPVTKNDPQEVSSMFLCTDESKVGTADAWTEYVTELGTVIVNGLSGHTIQLHTGDIPEGKGKGSTTQLFFTNSRVRAVDDVKNTKAQAATNKADIATNAGNISKNTTDINTVTTTANNNSTTISKNETDINNNLTKINKNISDISDVETTANNNTTIINKNKAHIGYNSDPQKYTGLYKLTQTNTSNISAVTTTANNNTTNIGKNTADISGNLSKINKNISDISDVETTANNNKTDIGKNTTDIKEAEQSISGLNTTVKTKADKTYVDNNFTKNADLQSDITNNSTVQANKNRSETNDDWRFDKVLKGYRRNGTTSQWNNSKSLDEINYNSRYTIYVQSEARGAPYNNAVGQMDTIMYRNSTNGRQIFYRDASNIIYTRFLSADQWSDWKVLNEDTGAKKITVSSSDNSITQNSSSYDEKERELKVDLSAKTGVEFIREEGGEKWNTEYTAQKDFWIEARCNFDDRGNSHISCQGMINAGYHYTGSITTYIKKGKSYKLSGRTGLKFSYHVKQKSSTSFSLDKDYWTYQPDEYNTLGYLHKKGCNVDPVYKTALKPKSDKQGYTQELLNAGTDSESWEYRTDPFPEHRDYCKWVEGKGYELDTAKKDKLIAAITQKIKAQTNKNIEEGKWLKEGDEQKFEAEENHLRFTSIEEAVSFFDTLSNKNMEELLQLLDTQKINLKGE
ncbi:MAG: hypothetical protein K9M56_04235 [Victivallales bacterium]|nr:hypothetical protein [Victivallales bacterium]